LAAFLHLDNIKFVSLFPKTLKRLVLYHTERMKTRVQWNLLWNWQLNTDLILIGIGRYFEFYIYGYVIILDL